MREFFLVFSICSGVMGLEVLTQALFAWVEHSNRFISFPIFAVVMTYVLTRLWSMACMVPYLALTGASVSKILFTPLKVFGLFYTFRFFYLVIAHDMSFKEAAKA